MDFDLHDISGNKKGTVSLSDNIFAGDISYGCIYYAINNELANRRVGTASTKTRAEVNYSNTKPFKQKGTGNARQGDKKSPIRVGGGVIFGPRPRDYSYTIPKKMKRNAMISLLSLAAQDGRMVVVEDFTTDGKTKNMQKIIDCLSAYGQRTVLIMKDDDALIRRSARNIPYLRVLSYDKLAARELFHSKRVILLETAGQKLGEFYEIKG